MAAMQRCSLLIAFTPLLLIGCGAPDTRALKTIACEQAAASLDMQSVSQMDALRKALGLAPGVDPLQQCRALGVRMEPAGGSAAGSGANEAGLGGETEKEADGETEKKTEKQEDDEAN